MTGKKTWPILAAILAAALATGCLFQGFSFSFIQGQGPGLRGDGKVVSRERQARGFDAVALVGSASLRVHPGRDFRVVVTTDENIQDSIETSVKGGELTLRFSPGSGPVQASEISFDVYLPALRAVSISGSGNARVESGSAESFLVSISGSGNVSAENFKARKVDISISGSGRMSVHASDLLVGRISGSGRVRLYGGGRHSVSVSGSGRVSEH